MLLGIDIDSFDIGAILEGDFFIKFNLHDNWIVLNELLSPFMDLLRIASNKTSFQS